ncbi:MAG: radical SAM family heme chaperone HemW [Eubacterium sp.]|nr:radical SAM family heme chaperone HemW [Eubacterium sp.]
MLELYIHIPFCIRKCNYCDFLSFPETESRIAQYCHALKEEIKRTGDQAEGIGVRSVFIGGGTPSILEAEQITEIMTCIRNNFSIEKNAEITIESNPGTLNAEKLNCYHELGINRLSIGLQSTDDDCLRRLGRIHTFQEFEKNYEQARKSGFQNINIDLMSGLPGQSLRGYEDTLNRVTELKPEHISSYSLIIEEGTPFYKSDSVLQQLPDEDTERKMYERTKEILAQQGYERYEISNYARQGRECIHNLGYWEQVPYLGMGLGASSFYNGARFSNERNFRKYLSTPYLPFEHREDYVQVSREEQMEDTMIFGLRKMKGISVSEFEREFGTPIWEMYGSVIERYSNLGLLIQEGDVLRLTDAGIDVSNRIFEDFIL